jgi:AraC-like DNA-binding protein
MAKPLFPHQSISAQLQTIWIVDADRTYDVVKNGSNSKDIVAVRTTAGEGILNILGVGDLHLTEGTLALFNINKILRYYCASENWSFFWFEFVCNTINLPEFEIVHNIKMQKYEFAKMHDCFHILNSPMQFSALRASCEFCSLLTLWSSSLSISMSQNTIAIEKVLKYISNHSHEDVSIIKLSKIAQMSERTFRDVFKQHTKQSPKKYIEDKKLNIARELIINTSMQIKAISESLGFTNQYYFSRAFKKMFGFSPVLYKKNLSHNAFKK